MPAAAEHVHIQIRGIVQGVGFRPFVHRKAEELGLTGRIRNTSLGVELEMEGSPAALDSFIAALRTDAPRMAVIASMQCTRGSALQGYTDFRIADSAALAGERTLISPDIGICDNCRRELFDQGDRRWRYPFVNCTDCGPRFTIIRDLPYDRKNTTMAGFAMCPDCLEEYQDIRSRRYHAQPDCCAVCGPRLLLRTAGETDTQTPQDQILERVKQDLKNGRIAAVKGLGGIHLACRADARDAVARLRRGKNRENRPFALMCRDADTAARYCEVSPEERRVLESPARPIVLLRKKEDFPFAGISDNRYAGIMLPYTPLHCLLLEDGPDTLVMTSANLPDLPILYRNEEIRKLPAGLADCALLHDRPIEAPCDDSLVWVFEGSIIPVRRSRGYVPAPVRVAHDGCEVLALGAEQKGSFCFIRDGIALMSQHIGDLKNMETMDLFTSQIRRFERLFDLHPQVLSCDLHPDYLSAAYAVERAEAEQIPLFPVQHHHAHMAACMAENAIEGDCIGIVWDGTGYGTDGSLWGGEFLTGGYTRYGRSGSLRQIPLPGGEQAIRQPWRVGAAMLLEAGLEPEEFFGQESRSVKMLLQTGLNCPLSSGAGRLFDGFSAVCGLIRGATYEGEGAVLLEAAAGESSRVYPVIFQENSGLLTFDWRDMMRMAAADLRSGVPVSEVTAGFMNTLAEMAVQMCGRIRLQSGLSRVVLSGGTFQNRYLMEHLVPALRNAGFSVFYHTQVPAVDQGLSLGQAMIAGRGGEEYVPCSAAADN